MPGPIFDLLQIEVINRPSFISDNTVTDKLIVGTFQTLSNSNFLSGFSRLDSVTIASFGIDCPYNYCQGVSSFQNVDLAWFDGVTNLIVSPIFQIALPKLNQAVEMQTATFPGFYSQMPDTGNICRLKMRFSVAISQIFAPAILQGTTQKLNGWAKLTHLLPLVP